jgi:putative FmdB family regulatory protein
MPTYEFRCPAGHDFEKFYRSISAAPSEVRCPSCGKIAARQMSAGGGLVFKGSGFYITDYGKDGKKPQVAPTVAGKEAGTQADGDAGAAKADSPKGAEAGPGGDKAAVPIADKPKATSESKPVTPAPGKKPKTAE